MRVSRIYNCVWRANKISRPELVEKNHFNIWEVKYAKCHNVRLWVGGKGGRRTQNGERRAVNWLEPYGRKRASGPLLYVKPAVGILRLPTPTRCRLLSGCQSLKKESYVGQILIYPSSYTSMIQKHPDRRRPTFVAAFNGIFTVLWAASVRLWARLKTFGAAATYEWCCLRHAIRFAAY